MTGRSVSARTAVHGALGVAVTLPVLLDFEFRIEAGTAHWLALMALNAAIWASWPRWRSPFLRQATATLTLLIAANLLLSPLVPVLLGVPMTTALPNQFQRLQHVGGVRPGLEGIHTVTTDARGHRTNRPVDYGTRTQGTLRIVAIGASTTEQPELDDTRIWTARLARRLEETTGREVEMINTATSGARAPQYAAALRGSLAYRPDLVLFLIGINDWNHAIRRANWTMAERFLVALQPFSFFDSVLYAALMRARGALAGRPSDMAVSGAATGLVEDHGTYFSSQNDSLERPRRIDFPVPSVDPAYAREVERLLADCRRHALPCLFVEQPTAYAPDIELELRRRLWMTPVNEPYTVTLDNLRQAAATYNGWLEERVRAAGLGFCPVARAFPARLELFYDDCHFTDAGSARLARLVADCLAALPGWTPRATGAAAEAVRPRFP